MPIVAKGSATYDQLIKPLKLDDALPQELPDITGMLQANASLASNIFEDEFPRNASARSNVSAQFMAASVSMGAGIPTSGGMWGATTPLLSVLPDDLITTFNDILGTLESTGASQSMVKIFDALKKTKGLVDFPLALGSALVESLLDMIGPMMDAVTGIVEAATSWIPILGGFIKTVTSLITIFNPPSPEWEEAEVGAMSFHPGLDVAFADSYFLRPMRGQWQGKVSNPTNGGHDLTNIFHPPGTTVSSPVLVRGTKDTSNPIRRIVAIGGAGSDGLWAGMIPGSMLVDHGWDISKNGKTTSGTRALGSLSPTGSDIGSKLWGMITQAGSPLMYTLEPEVLKKRWSDYLWSLRTRIVGDEDDPNWGYWNAAAKAEFINKIAGKAYGWSLYPTNDGAVGGNEAKEVPWGNGTKIIDQEKSFGLENSIPMRALDNLAELQKGALDNTAVCAYIDESYPGIQYNSALKEQWAANRMLLLQHPLRCTVDVDSIPDQGYRNAMIDAKQSCGMIISAGPVNLHPNAPPTVAVIQGLSAPGESGDNGRGSGGKGGLILAAAVLGLIVMNKKRR